MWPWRHKSLRRRHLLWIKLLASSTLFHLIVCVGLFFVRQDTVFEHMFTLHTQCDADVVIVFADHEQKQVHNPAGQNTVKNNTTHDLKNKIVQAETLVKPSTKPAPQKPVQPKSVQKSETKKQQSKDKQTQKKTHQNQVAKPQEKKPEPKKIEPKKQVVTHDKPQSPSPLKKEQQKIEKPIESNKPQNNINQVANITDKQQIEALKNNGDTHSQYIVVHNYAQKEAAEQYLALQKEFSRCWKPPVGVPEDCACEIKLMIGPNGAIEDVTMAKPSGVLMYDVAARSAVFAMEFPRWSWRKSLILTFKQ